MKVCCTKRRNKKSAVQTHENLSDVYDEKAFKVQQYRNWFAKYQWARGYRIVLGTKWFRFLRKIFICVQKERDYFFTNLIFSFFRLHRLTGKKVINTETRSAMLGDVRPRILAYRVYFFFFISFFFLPRSVTLLPDSRKRAKYRYRIPTDSGN